MSYDPSPAETSPWLKFQFLILRLLQSTTPLWSPSPSDFGYKWAMYLGLKTSSWSSFFMANNFSLSPEDRLLWQQRALRTFYWFQVSNMHPFINGGQPVEMAPPPPPYTPALPPIQSYLNHGSPVSSIPGAVHPGAIIPLPSINPVPIYNVRHYNGMGSNGADENAHPSVPSHKFYSTASIVLLLLIHLY